MKRGFLAFVILMVPSTLFFLSAQEISEEAIKLAKSEEVQIELEVQATGTSIASETAPVITVTKEELEQYLLDDASEALDLIPGNMLNTSGNRASINSISVRGSRSSQVSTHINGVNIVSPLGFGGGDPSKIPTSFIDQIELYRGAGGAFFGNGSTAGALNIVTSAPTKKSIEARYLYDYLNGHLFSFQFSTPLTNPNPEEKQSGLSVGAEFVYNPTDIPIIFGDTVDNSYLANLNLIWGEETSKYKLTFINFIEELFTQEIIGTTTQNFQSLHLFQWELKEVGYSGSFSFRPIDSRWNPTDMASDINTTFSLNLQNNYELDHYFDQHSLFFDANLNLQADFVDSTSMANTLVTRQMIEPAAHLQIHLAMPNERKVAVIENSFQFSAITGDRSFFFPSGALGLLFYLDNNEKVTLKNSVANGFRAPSLSELYFATTGYDPNPKLTDEKNISFDTELNYQPIKEINLGAVYFLRKEWNAIYWLNNTSENVDTLNFQGTELYFDANFTIKEDFHVGGNINYQFAYGQYDDKSPFGYAHEHIFKSNFFFAYKKYINVGFYLAGYSGYADIDPFCEFNIKAKIGFKDFYLTLSGDNLLNHELRYHQYTTPLGRSFSIGFQYRHDSN